MIGLEVLVNGRRVCVAGIRRGALDAAVTRMVGDNVEFINFRVGGLEGDSHLRWTVPKIGVGDEVTIRVVDVPAADPPA